MKLTTSNNDFAACMRKIQPAVSLTKEKKGVREGVIQINIINTKIEDSYIGVAVAYDGKKQLISTFLIKELDMEEESLDLYLSGKRICDISNVFTSSKEQALVIEVNKNCIIKKGSSQAQVPIGEQPVIIQPGNDILYKADIKTQDLVDLINCNGRFYISSNESVLNSICIKYDIKNNLIAMSSSDGYKIAYGEKPTKYECSKSEEGKETSPKEFIHLIEGEELKILSRFLEYETTELYIYEKSLYLKCGTDVAIFLTKDSEEGNYPLEDIIKLRDGHSGKQKIELLPENIIEALNVFDVVNQEEHPYIYIKREKNGMLCFLTKGKTGKTIVEADVDSEFKEVVLNSKMLRQVIGNFEKDKKMVIFVGEEEEQVLLKQKVNAKDFGLMLKIED